jgi:hypothetical protein
VADRPSASMRDAFLASVSAHLDLPRDAVPGVLEELADHLADATDELIGQGVAADDAERRAIGRFGDPRALGGELSRARHTRRQVWAAVGGGIRGLVVEGVRTWIFAAMLVVVAFLLASPLFSFVLHAQGRSSGYSTLIGSSGSLLTSLLGLISAGYLGWVLPTRVARSAGRSVRGVRRAVAAVGLVGGSAFLWLVPQMDLDPVLAVGLAITPLAFALAAFRAPERPTVRVGIVPALVGGVLLCLPMTALAVATATDSGQGGWMADTSPIGADRSTNAASVSVNWSTSWASERGAVTVSFPDAAAAAEFAKIRVEAWPTQVRDGVMEFGRAPLIVAAAAVSGLDTTVSYRLPALRDPVTTTTFLVGVRTDGSRIVFDEDLSLTSTPPWRGTLFDWWAGRP